MHTASIHTFIHRYRKYLPWVLVTLLIGIGAFLRLYRLEGFAMFLGDQGRDAIIFKRLITFEHFPAIGAPTSVGQIYMGPFYYYFIAPWLLLTNFNPVGAALGVSVVSIIGLWIQFQISKHFFGERTAILGLILTVFSGILIDFSRFSWNPNLLPLFMFMTWFATMKAITNRKPIWYFIAGSLFALSLQLHYLAIFFGLPMALYFIQEILKHRNDWFHSIVNICISAGGFILFTMPLILFEFKHQFLNTKSLLHLSGTQGTLTNPISGMIQTFIALNTYIFHISLSQVTSIILLAGFFLIIVSSILLKRNPFFMSIGVFFFCMLLGISFYGGPKYPHYLGPLYIFYLIAIAYILKECFTKITMIFLVAFIGIYLFIQFQYMPFLNRPDQGQINKAQIIAHAIADHITSKKYSVTSLPHQYSDSTYRYFLEIWGERPIEKDSLEKADELFVVCEEQCHPIGDPQWDIAYFAPDKIQWQQTINGNTIYKLTHI